MNNRDPHHPTEQHAHHQEHDTKAGAQQAIEEHATLEHDTQVKNPPESRHLPYPLFSLDKQAIIICTNSDGQVNREYRFERKDICRFSSRIDDLYRRRSGSDLEIIDVYQEPLHDIFANYDLWVRSQKLPELDVAVADQRDVLVLWISMYELARRMEDWRLVAAVNVKIIAIGKLGSWSFYQPSVKMYIKKAAYNDELRQLLLNLHVACFDIRLFKRYFWKLSPRLVLAIVRRKMLDYPPTIDGIASACTYHKHDHLFRQGDCEFLK